MLEKINNPQDLRRLTVAELEILATEIRQTIVRQVANKGGHLAPNLGAVEITLALHYVFQTPEDKLIWDVGHQAYPHKLVTGRFDQFHTLKQHGGISGFLKRSESQYDVFGAGHASTSLAAAMGLAVSRTKQKKKHRVVAVIGDGSLTGGMAYEALNNAGTSDERVTFVLNDNRMSIAPNVGAISKYLNRIISNPTYNKVKDEVWEFAGKLPKGKELQKIVQRLDETVKHLVLPGGFFEDLGLRYFGPVDGHDLEELIEIFDHLKDLNHPTLVHVITEKGRGWDKAEQDAYKWHASSPFDIDSGKSLSAPGLPSLANVFGSTLLELANKDDRIIAITAAMPDGTGLQKVIDAMPDRVFDVGIAEQYGVTFAAGLACDGMKPVVAIYSTFLQRAYDQIIHDVAIQDLNVVFAMSHGGLVGLDGPTHHGALDLSYLRLIPKMVVMAPSDEKELRDCLHTALQYNDGPIALRFPKASAREPIQLTPFRAWPMGVPKIDRVGEHILILAVGGMVHNARAAAGKLEQEGCLATVADVRFIKPLNEKWYKENLSRYSAVLTVEDNVKQGGYGSAVLEFMQENNLQAAVTRLGLPDAFVTHGEIPKLHAELGMDAAGIFKSALELVRSSAPKVVR